MMVRTTKKPVLREGMREGDLADLVLPLISVDEYCSQIDSDEALVLGFYVHDEMAAKDLNRFLQKSAVPLLGTEVSPAPDQHGYFMVFVEMMDNDRLGENLTAILHEISTLVDIDEWQIRVRSAASVMPFSIENLEHAIAKAKRLTKKVEVVEYLQHSALRNAELSDTLLILEGAGDRYCFDFIGFDRIDDLLRKHKLTEVGVSFDIRGVAKANKITRMLGENWEASRMGAFILLNRDQDERGLLLKL
jgi:hypothetical protein